MGTETNNYCNDIKTLDYKRQIEQQSLGHTTHAKTAVIYLKIFKIICTSLLWVYTKRKTFVLIFVHDIAIHVLDCIWFSILKRHDAETKMHATYVSARALHMR